MIQYWIFIFEPETHVFEPVQKAPFGKLTNSRNSCLCTCLFFRTRAQPDSPLPQPGRGTPTVRLTYSHILLLWSGRFILIYNLIPEPPAPLLRILHAPKSEFREFVSSPKGTFFEPVQNVSFVKKKKPRTSKRQVWCLILRHLTVFFCYLLQGFTR